MDPLHPDRHGPNPTRPKIKREWRILDYSELVLSVVAIALWTFGYIDLAGKVDNGTRRQDLVAGCLRNSARTAADVNLNWIYYLSEKELTATPSRAGRRATARAIASLSPHERAFIAFLERGQGPNRRAIEARAQADYDAAHAKARNVDVTQTRLVDARTPLGSGATPRRWVIEADFSCERAFR